MFFVEKHARGELHGERRAGFVVKGKPFQPRSDEPSGQGELLVSGGRKMSRAHVSKVDWQSDKLTSEQGRFLNRVFTEFAQYLAPQLTPLLQLRAMVDLEEVIQEPYKEFLEDFSQPTPLAIFSLDEKSKGIIAFDTFVSFAILDFFTGGKGEVLEEPREFTEIESALFRNQLLSRFVSAFCEAWKEISPLSCRVENLEYSPNSVMLYPYEEVLLTAKFMLRAGVVSGHFEMAVPLKFVRAVLPKNPDQFVTQTEIHKAEGPPTPSSPFVGRKIESTPVAVSVELGDAEVYFQDLLSLEEGDILRLQAHKNEPLRIKVGGKTKFLGRPATSEKKMVIRITDIIQEGDENFDD